MRPPGTTMCSFRSLRAVRSASIWRRRQTWMLSRRTPSPSRYSTTTSTRFPRRIRTGISGDGSSDAQHWDGCHHVRQHIRQRSRRAGAVLLARSRNSTGAFDDALACNRPGGAREAPAKIEHPAIRQHAHGQRFASGAAQAPMMLFTLDCGIGVRWSSPALYACPRNYGTCVGWRRFVCRWPCVAAFQFWRGMATRENRRVRAGSGLQSAKKS